MSDDDNRLGYGTAGALAAGGAAGAIIERQKARANVKASDPVAYAAGENKFNESDAGKAILQKEAAHENVAKALRETSGASHIVVERSDDGKKLLVKKILPLGTKVPEDAVAQFEIDTAHAPAFLTESMENNKVTFPKESISGLVTKAEDAIKKLGEEAEVTRHAGALANIEHGFLGIVKGSGREMAIKAVITGGAAAVGALSIGQLGKSSGHLAAQESRRETPTETTR